MQRRVNFQAYCLAAKFFGCQNTNMIGFVFMLFIFCSTQGLIREKIPSRDENGEEKSTLHAL